jgi:hypothetical protein
MCMACDEMQLYYAYLDAVEEAKRKAQPWECEVTLIAQDGEPGAEAAMTKAVAPESATVSKPKKSTSTRSKAAKAGFACD